MTTLLHAVSTWWTAHPSWVNFIYFIIAVVISIFSDSVRAFVVSPVTHQIKKMNWHAQRDLQHRLRLIQALHNNTFGLVLYVAFGFVDAIVSSALFAAGFNLLLLLTSIFTHDRTLSTISPYSFFVGGIVGRAIAMRQVLRYLFDYESSVKMLTAAVVVAPPEQATLDGS